MPPVPLKSLIFDLDGTLTDPREGITRSITHALESLKRPGPELRALEKYIGPPIQTVFQDLLQTTDAALVQEAVRLYRERYADVGLYENLPYEGIGGALSALRKQGFDLWVCTSKPWVFAEKILERFELEPHFVALYGCELDGTRSNKAELLKHLLDQEKLDPKSCVMIGDRKHDALAARANETRSLGVLYGFGDEEELRHAGVDAVCLTPGELPDAIARLGAVE